MYFLMGIDFANLKFVENHRVFMEISAMPLLSFLVQFFIS
jgi:hypothetical protein